MKFASLILRIFHGINLVRLDGLDSYDRWFIELRGLIKLIELIGSFLSTNQPFNLLNSEFYALLYALCSKPQRTR
ncbi:MAG: hypothetical protein JSW26_21745, partial [Desulfobacterales bacterium]